MILRDSGALLLGAGREFGVNLAAGDCRAGVQPLLPGPFLQAS